MVAHLHAAVLVEGDDEVADGGEHGLHRVLLRQRLLEELRVLDAHRGLRHERADQALVRVVEAGARGHRVAGLAAAALVDHLAHAEQLALAAVDGDAEDGGRPVAGGLVELLVEAVVLVRVLDVDDLVRRGDAAGDAAGLCAGLS